MQLISTFSLTLAIALPIAAQRGPSDTFGPRFQWEEQAPWGVAHHAAIAEAIKLTAMNPIDPEALRVEPFKIFDNVYYIGLKNVSSFLIPTTDGLVLLDATFPATANLLLDNVRKLGFRPDNIKYVLVSHSHPDHFGGAGRIQELTGARVVMSLEDWKSVERQQEAAKQAGRDLGVPLTRDVVKGEGDTLKVGDTEFKFYLTPGHTVGALSAEFKVFDHGKAYRALSPGGLGMQFGPEGTESYITSLQRLVALGPWDVLLTNHPFYLMDDLDHLRSALAARGSGPNPAVSDPAKIHDWLDGAVKTARAKRAAELNAEKH